MANQLPDPFHVKIIEGLAKVETEVVALRGQISNLASRNEVAMHRWIMGGFFAALLTLVGWVVRIKL
jgi:hypothetical protein